MAEVTDVAAVKYVECKEVSPRNTVYLDDGREALYITSVSGGHVVDVITEKVRTVNESGEEEDFEFELAPIMVDRVYLEPPTYREHQAVTRAKAVLEETRQALENMRRSLAEAKAEREKVQADVRVANEEMQGVKKRIAEELGLTGGHKTIDAAMTIFQLMAGEMPKYMIDKKEESYLVEGLEHSTTLEVTVRNDSHKGGVEFGFKKSYADKLLFTTKEAALRCVIDRIERRLSSGSMKAREAVELYHKLKVEAPDHVVKAAEVESVMDLARTHNGNVNSTSGSWNRLLDAFGKLDPESQAFVNSKCVISMPPLQEPMAVTQEQASPARRFLLPGD